MCAATNAEDVVLLDDLFHLDNENLYDDLGGTAGFDDDETVAIIDYIEDTSIANTICCANAWAVSLGHCLGRWGKAYTRCRNSYQSSQCGSCG